MKQYGYAGNIVYVDLTTRIIRTERLSMEITKDFIGDFGIDAKLAYDLIKPGIDPLSPENVIIVGAGPLVGTGAPSSARWHLFTKYPLTNTIGPSGGPMGFGANLKYSGYDHLIISGRAYQPVYLEVNDDGIQFHDATELWGKDIYEATDALWLKHGRKYSVVSISQAGENLVKISMAIVDGSGTVGRYGLGAVMGSKNLKAIIAHGTKGVQIADLKRFRKAVNQVMADIRKWPIRDEFVKLGHGMYDFDGQLRLSASTNYFTQQLDVGLVRQRMGPDQYRSRVKGTRFACPECPVPCRDIAELKKGKYKGLKTLQSQMLHTHGDRLDLKNIDNLLRLTNILQRYGIDRFAFCDDVQFVTHLCDLGYIPKADLEGLGLGQDEAILELVEKIAFRRGIGDAMADGLSGILNRFGKQYEKLTYSIKGAELFLDVRLSKLGTHQLDLVVSPVGPLTGKGGMVNPGKFDPSASVESFEKYGKKIGIPSQALEKILDTPLKVDTGRLLRHIQDFYAIYCSLGVCMRVHAIQFYDMERFAELYSAASGFETDATALKKAGERIWNLYKILNVREGQSRKDDTIPAQWFEPLTSFEKDKEIRLTDYYETKMLTPDDLQKILDDFYDERGWEIERGIPTKSKLADLGLSWVIEDLEKNGVFLT